MAFRDLGMNRIFFHLLMFLHQTFIEISTSLHFPYLYNEPKPFVLLLVVDLLFKSKQNNSISFNKYEPFPSVIVSTLNPDDIFFNVLEKKRNPSISFISICIYIAQRKVEEKNNDHNQV